MEETPGQRPLMQGEILFSEGAPSFTKASIHIYLEDTTLADAPARVALHQVMADVPAELILNNRIPFVLYGTIPDPRARYTVRVLVDVDGDGRISHGDYISTASYPVLTQGYPDQVVIQVKRVR